MVDSRNFWLGFLDNSVNNTGSGEAGQWWRPIELGVSPMEDYFSANQVVRSYTLMNQAQFFLDTLGVCFLATNANLRLLVEAVGAATGWDFKLEEAAQIGWRISTLFRALNIKLGINADTDGASLRYSSVPIDGPGKGRNIAPAWEDIKKGYFRLMGWDELTGKPLLGTLRELGLDFIIPDLY